MPWLFCDFIIIIIICPLTLGNESIGSVQEAGEGLNPEVQDVFQVAQSSWANTPFAPNPTQVPPCPPQVYDTSKTERCKSYMRQTLHTPPTYTQHSQK